VKHLSGISRPAAELIGRAGGRGHPLRVVGIDPVRREILKLGQATEAGDRRRVVEQKLVRDRLGSDLARHGKIAVSLEAAAFVFGGKLNAEILALRIVERGEHIGGAELAVVDEIGGVL
jgi:hypothetical protein